MPIKIKEETQEKIIALNKNNDYTTGNLLNGEYFSKHYKLFTIDLNKQIKLENPDFKQQSLKLQEDRATMFFSSLKNQKKQLLNFHKNL